MARSSQHQTAVNFRVLDSSEIYRRALTGLRTRKRFAAGLHSAHSQPPTTGENFQLILRTDRAGDKCSGHDRSKSLHGEGAINRESCEALAAALCNTFRG